MSSHQTGSASVSSRMLTRYAAKFFMARLTVSMMRLSLGDNLQVADEQHRFENTFVVHTVLVGLEEVGILCDLSEPFGLNHIHQHRPPFR